MVLAGWFICDPCSDSWVAEAVRSTFISAALVLLGLSAFSSHGISSFRAFPCAQASHSMFSVRVIALTWQLIFVCLFVYFF